MQNAGRLRLTLGVAAAGGAAGDAAGGAASGAWWTRDEMLDLKLPTTDLPLPRLAVATTL